jgi:hypothetical protein
VQLSPNPLSHNAKRNEHDCRDDGPHHLKPVIPMGMRCPAAVAAVPEFPESYAKADLSSRESEANNDNGNEELAIDERGMLCGAGRKPPFSSKK